jgi:hypothetical protein
METSRWVQSELAGLKRDADDAGLRFREARKHCLRSNMQYYFHRELLKLKPLPIFAPSAERRAQLNTEAAERVRHWDAERQAARIALDNAKLNLDKAVTRYREAKSRQGKKHEG